MNLKRQLLLIGLLLVLCLPWAGCQFVREIESVLRKGQEQALETTALGIARVLQAEPSILEVLSIGADDSSAANALQFSASSLPIVVDGYAEDWADIEEQRISSARDPDQHIRYRAATINDRLYLFLQCRDKDINFFDPSEPNGGDRVELVVAGDEYGRRSERFVVASSTPGKVNVRRRSTRGEFLVSNEIEAHWQDTVGGFNIEIGIPISITGGRLGFYRADETENARTDYYGSIPRSLRLAPKAIYSSEALQLKLQAFERPGQRIALVSTDGREIASEGRLAMRTTNQSYWLLRYIYQTILSLPAEEYREATDRAEILESFAGERALRWYKGQDYSERSILALAQPLRENDSVTGTVVLEQSNEQFLALTDSAFTRLLLLTFVGALLISAILVAYASWLSWRIRRLSQAAASAVNEDGSVNANFVASTANDEIGGLSRAYSTLLGRVGSYTEYLRTLSRKLSHELRTPLAVVHTSLDNLESDDDAAEIKIYAHRAKEGATQLSRMITALSEATRVEESISSAEKENIDVLGVISDIALAYDDTFKQHTVAFANRCGVRKLELKIAAELIAQMLDKLLDNAADFAPRGTLIEISTSLRQDQLVVAVQNSGSKLDESMQASLFENLVSVRKQESTKAGAETHLGLGLHIVKLIAEFHHGTVAAKNLPADEGVRFEVKLPLADNQSDT